MTKNLAAVFLHNAVADTQAQAGSLADFFGGEEGIENLIGMRNPVAVVAEGNFDGVAGFGGHDFDARGAANFVHGVVGVVENVEKDLLQLMGVAHHIGQPFVQVLDDFDAVAGEVVGAQLNGAAQDHIELHGVALRRHLAGKAEQVLHDLLGALGFLQNYAQIFARGFGKVGILHEQDRRIPELRSADC